MKNLSLSNAVHIAGGQVKLAAKIKHWHAQQGNTIKISQAHVWNWLNSDSLMPPAEHCRAIEEITNGSISRYDLRPDVFGLRPTTESTQEAA